jgi:multidrug resistance efflux pump
MAASVRVVYADGTDQFVGIYDTLDDATAAAFELADTSGSIGNRTKSPERVRVVESDRVILSIRIFKGGLHQKKEAPQ